MKQEKQPENPIKQVQNDGLKYHNCSTFTGFPFYYKKEKAKNGETIITGCNPNKEMEKGEAIILPSTYGYFIIKSVERRNCAGNFKNKKNAENSFFKAHCQYVQPTFKPLYNE